MFILCRASKSSSGIVVFIFGLPILDNYKIFSLEHDLLFLQRKIVIAHLVGHYCCFLYGFTSGSTGDFS